MSKKRILTGDRPTGRLHIGHYFGSIKTRLKLQENDEYEPLYNSRCSSINRQF